MCYAARAVTSRNSYGHVLLEENQHNHIYAGSKKIEVTAPELNFGISLCLCYERGGRALTSLVLCVAARGTTDG